jgi:hypothetical protein
LLHAVWRSALFSVRCRVYGARQRRYRAPAADPTNPPTRCRRSSITALTLTSPIPRALKP